MINSRRDEAASVWTIYLVALYKNILFEFIAFHIVLVEPFFKHRESFPSIINFTTFISRANFLIPIIITSCEH